MAEDTAASVISFYQVPPDAKTRTGAGRAKTNDKANNKAKRQRKPRKPKAAVPSEEAASAAEAGTSPSESLIPAEYLADWAVTEPSDPQVPAVTSEVAEPVTLSQPQEAAPPLGRQLVPMLLSAAALGLAAAGIMMNGWFARSLGSSDIASWLFLAIGAAADLVALAMPSCAAGLWRGGHRATALVGWAVWLMTFVFAVTSGIGFASTNIADTTLARASRVTPAVMTAQSALADAMAARDRECKGGVGKFCREREAAVAERRQILDSATTSVGQTADPQTDAAMKIVTWVSHGMLRPTAEDFAMLRLVLLAMLPQIGGILLMVGRLGRP